MKFKGICAVIMAAVATLSMTMSASAADVTEITLEQTRETVNIGGYECWVEDGHYLTNDNGEIVEVIDLAEATTTSAVDDNDVDTLLSLQANNEVDLTDGSTYYGTIDATTSDYVSPVFIGWRYNGDGGNFYPNARLTYALHCEDFVLNRPHRVVATVYDFVLEEYLTNPSRLITFTPVTKTFYFVNGMTNNAPTKIYFTFPNGEDNKKVTNYSVYTLIKDYS